MEHPAYQAIQNPPSPTQEAVPANPSPNQSGGKWKKWMLIGFLLIIIALPLGIFILSQQKNDKPQEKTTSQQAVKPSPTPDPTADWKTFTSKKYNFSVKYPPAWKVEEVAESKDINEGWVDFVSDVLVCEPEGDHTGCNVRIKYSPNNFPGTKITLVNDKIIDSSGNPLTTTKEVLGNTTAYRTTDIGAMGDQLTYVVAGENNNFHVFGMNPYNPKSDKNTYLESTFKQILQTFKFTEPEPTMDVSNWKTYSNTEYNFTLNYPNFYAIRPEQDKITFFQDQSDNAFFVNIHANASQLSVPDWLNNNYAQHDLNKLSPDRNYKTKHVTVGGQPGLEIELVGDFFWKTHIFVLSPNGKRIFEFTGNITQGQNDHYTRGILSTFKFIQ